MASGHRRAPVASLEALVVSTIGGCVSLEKRPQCGIYRIVYDREHMADGIWYTN